jgi:hypothetical protein
MSVYLGSSDIKKSGFPLGEPPRKGVLGMMETASEPADGAVGRGLGAISGPCGKA